MQVSSSGTGEPSKAANSKAGKRSPPSLSVKNPAKKTTATAETTNTTPATRRAQTAKWLTVFRRRGGLAELASVAEAVGSSGDCVWAERSLLGMLPSFPLTN
ncbi:MAG: hypothetical protein JOY55_05295 [Mycobacterium sp.]|nr:hypothetical protein [Mycobacterium sp.]